MKIIQLSSRFIVLFMLGFFFLGMRQARVYTVKFKMTNIRNSKGQIQLQFYKDETTFKAEKPFKQIYIPKNDVKNQYLEHTITIEGGVYGFAMLDDENNNGKMDYRILPQEGFAFSNYYLSGWNRPKLDDFKIMVSKNTFVVMKFRYL